MTLIFCTLLGKTAHCRISLDDRDLKYLWTKDTEIVAKVNALIVDERRVIIGGLGKENKGVIEIWNRM
jgi:hypothetical protein